MQVLISNAYFPDNDTPPDDYQTTEFYANRDIRNNKCHFKPEHYYAYGRWANARNESSGVNSIIPIIPHHELRTVSRKDIRGRTIIAGSVHCPEHPTEDHYDHDSLMARSLCPWYWRMNYNSKRIPSILPEAVCRCPRAVTGTPSVSFECQPLIVRLRVLKFDLNCNSYKERTESLSVACISVMHSSKKLFKQDGIESSQDSLPYENF